MSTCEKCGIDHEWAPPWVNMECSVGREYEEGGMIGDALYTFQHIDDLTGFANGEGFESDEQARSYFTVDNMRFMFGECSLTQLQLDTMARVVIKNRWHFKHKPISGWLVVDRWTSGWPVNPGWYWFYGWTSEYDKRTGEPKLRPVQVSDAGPAEKRFRVYVCGGAFLYEGEGAEGKWRPMDVPELPKL